MSEGLNRVLMIGTVADPPGYRLTASGKARLWLRLKVAEGYVDREGEARERQGWYTVVVWGPRATELRATLRQGQRLAVDGRLDNWKKDGDPPRWVTEVVARDVLVLDRASATTALRPPDRDAA